jgi:glycosyltransferase involved in cell wall biosynthesis
VINKQPKSVTIIIRSKNESKWISSCLKSVKSQNYEKNKIQIILLDNNSTDKTKNIAKKYHVKIVDYKPRKYFPGAALNKAVKIAKNEIMVFLSAHCIPTNNNWLRNLINSFEHNTAAVYGKQYPYSFSSFVDKRDLYNQFGIERRVQKKDNFFHNANSAIQKKLLIKFPFENNIEHIEDRIWAKKILKKKYNIVYEPKASVWHYHGLNHSNNEKRTSGVGKILENFILDKSKNFASIQKTHNLLTIISHNPKKSCKEFVKELDMFRNLLGKNKPIGDVCVVSHLKKKEFEKFLKLNFIFFKNKKKNLRTIKKIKFTLKSYEKFSDKIIDAVLIIDTSKIFKNIKIYKDLFDKFFVDHYDTVIPIRKDFDMYWKLTDDNELLRLDQPNKLRKNKKPLFKSLSENATVISPELIMNEKRLGDKIGCVLIS